MLLLFSFIKKQSYWIIFLYYWVYKFKLRLLYMWDTVASAE